MNDDIQREHDDLCYFEAVITELVEAARPFWHWGDGYGGAVIEKIQEAFKEGGLPSAPVTPPRPSRHITRSLAKAVFERDGYRCVQCASHYDLTCDHIIPVSKGGVTEPTNLQTMCRSCNSSKGAK